MLLYSEKLGVEVKGKDATRADDQIETNPFIEYVCDIFDDDAPQTMKEIFGDDKQL